MKTLYYIAIEGVIGVGKTSLAKLLAERLEGRILLEQAEENPYIQDFYRDPQRYAFQIQLYFLTMRYRQLMVLPQQDLFHKYLIADYIFAKDRIFAYLNLEDRDLVLYERLATLMERELEKPDLVIYLQSSTDRLMKNIRNRKIDFEKQISMDYLRSLNEAYNDFFFKYSDSPLLVINTTEIDFVNNEEDLNDLIHQVLNPPAGMKYYVPRKG